MKIYWSAGGINAYMTITVFIYGFTGVIAFISLLNIINTMNTSIASKMKYLRVMRAVGMSGKQLDRMVFAQSITYSFLGCRYLLHFFDYLGQYGDTVSDYIIAFLALNTGLSNILDYIYFPDEVGLELEPSRGQEECMSIIADKIIED